MTSLNVLTKPQAIVPEKLWRFLKKLSLSRPVETANLVDGVLVAEIIHTYVSLLVTATDLQKFARELQSDVTGMGVWATLSRTALKQLCIHLSEEILAEMVAGNKDSIQEFLGVLMQQIEHYKRVQSNYSTVPRAQFIEHFHNLTTPRTFRGTQYVPPATSLHAKTLIRLSNVDYQTTKTDVQKFLYPIIAHQSEIHIPIHLASGKMTYTIYVEFDDRMLPLKAVDLHSGHTLLSRRVEITVVSMDELYYTLYGRTLSGGPLSSSAAILPMPSTPTATTMPNTPTGSTESTDDYFSTANVTPRGFLSEDTQEQITKLCKTVKNSFNGKTPDRPFEHIISFLRLLPWQESLLTQVEVERGFELLLTAVVTLILYLQNDTQKQKFSVDLLHRLVSCGKSLPFTTKQVESLQNVYMSYIRDPTAPIASVQSLIPASSVPTSVSFTSAITAVNARTNKCPPRPSTSTGTTVAQRRDPLRLDLLARRLKNSGAPPALSINIPTATVVFPAPLSAPLKTGSDGTASAGIPSTKPPTLSRSITSLGTFKSHEPLHSAPLYGSFDYTLQRSPFAAPLSASALSLHLDGIAASATDMPSYSSLHSGESNYRYPSPAPSFKSGAIHTPSCLSLSSILSADTIFSPMTPMTPEIYLTPSEEIDVAPEIVLGAGLWAAM